MKKLILFMVLVFGISKALGIDLPSDNITGCTKNGITYNCSSDLIYNNNVEFVLSSNVTIYIEGNFEAKNKLTVEPNGYELNLVVTGSIDINNNLAYTGNLIAGGNVEIKNNGEIDGDITTGGTLDLGNNTVVDGYCTPSNSQCTGSGTSFLVDDDKAQCPTAAFTTIQSAIDLAPAGQEIIICDGTYNEAVQITNNKNNLTVKSQSGDPTKVTVNATASNHAFDIRDSSSVKFDSLTINGQNSAIMYWNNPGSLAITNSILSSQNDHTVYIGATTGTDINISNNSFTKAGDGYKSAIQFQAGTNGGTIADNNISTNNDSGYGVYIQDEPSNLTVTNNCFSDIPNEEAYSHATGSNPLVWDGNYWEDKSWYGVVDNTPLDSCGGEILSIPSPISEFRFDSCKKEDTDFKIDSIRSIEGEPVGNVAATLNAQICNGMQTFDEGDIDAWNAFDTKFNINSYPQGSVVFWFNSFTDWSGSDGLGRVLIDATKGNKYFFLGLTSDGALKFYFENTTDDDYQSYSTNSYDFSKNTWHQLAVSWDALNSRASVFIDGNEIPMTVTQNTLDGGGFGNSYGNTVIGDVRVEYTQNSAVFDGLRNSSYGIFDEVKFYDTPLSEEQIKVIYDNEVQHLDWEGNERSCKDCVAQLPICFEDDFNRNSLKSVYGDKAWNVLQHDNFTPEIFNNKLRLTDSQEKISAATNLVPSFNSKNNVFTLEFKHYAYDDSNDCSGDGMAFILSDANTTPEAGSFGGSLGYAQKDASNSDCSGDNCRGFAGGWLGIGVDEYGNFSNPTEGRDGGTGRVQNSVAIRGGQGVNRLSGYEFIDGTASLTTNPIAFPDSTTPEPGDTYRVIVDTRNEKTLISIDRDVNDGNGYQRLITQTDATQVAQAPESFIITLSGSTGGCRNIHELDDLVFRADNCGEFNNLSATAPNSRIWRNCPVNFADGNSSLLTQITDREFDIYVPILGDDNNSYSSEDFNGTLTVDIYTDDQKNDDLSYSIDNKQISNTDRCHNLSSDTEFDSLQNSAFRKVQIEACLSTSSDSEKTCSGLSDPFSIRPASFNMTQNISLSDLRAGEASTLINEDSIEAVGLSTARVTDYNTTSADMNISIAVTNSPTCDSSTAEDIFDFITKKPDDINYSYDDVSDINFTDGVLSNSFDIAFKDVGELDVNVTVKDSDWTSIDQPNDCIENSHSNTPDTFGKVGCEFIVDTHDKVTVYPYKLDIEMPSEIKTIGYDTNNFIYYGDNGNDFNKTMIFNFKINAVSKDGNITKNYDTNCFAEFDAQSDVNISIQNINDDFILKYKFNDSSSSKTDANGNLFELINLATNKESFSSGSSDNNLSFVLDTKPKLMGTTEIKTPINPTKIDSSDSNITFDVFSDLDGADINGSGISGDATKGLATNNTMYYYFGRLTPIDAETTDEDANVTFYIDVYCTGSCGDYNLNTKSVKYPASWYINTNEHNLTIQGSSLSSDETDEPDITIDNNGKGTANFQKNVNTFYGKAKVDIDLNASDKTFIYYNPYSDTNITRFYIDFLPEPSEDETPDDVIDNQGKDSESGRRLRW